MHEIVNLDISHMILVFTFDGNGVNVTFGPSLSLKRQNLHGLTQLHVEICLYSFLFRGNECQYNPLCWMATLSIVAECQESFFDPSFKKIVHFIQTIYI